MKFEPGKKSGKLDKMSMPKKKSPLDDVAVMELEMDPSDKSDDSESDDSGDESDMSNELAGESEGETDGPLADASDEDLLAEVRKRGLSEKAESADDGPKADDEY